MLKTKKFIIRTGAALSTLLASGGVALAQTTTPGVPSTAVGGQSGIELVVLALSLALVFVGVMLFGSQKVA